MRKVKVGIIGCGNISSIYLKNLTQMFENIEVVACADLMEERAKAQAKEFNVSKTCSVKELLKDPAVEIIVNLTTPEVHADIAIKALEAGKHVYGEKPLAITREEGKKILDTAEQKGLLVGSAPDTFLGGGIQTCIKLIEDGWIGRPVAATAFMTCHGHESWHPDPEFYYKVGGGPMFDMGPYYLTALIALMGSVKRVTGSAQKSFEERLITSEPKHGTKIKVDVPTHVAGVLDFKNGAVGTMITSFDVWHAQLPRIEIYGTEGTLSVPDPNTFGGPIKLRRMGAEEWTQMPLAHGFAENSRGLGIADMACAIVKGTPHRANGALAYQVLDIMHGIHDASISGQHYEIQVACEKPQAMPAGIAK